MNKEIDLTKYRKVYVSSISVEEALENKRERILLAELP